MKLNIIFILIVLPRFVFAQETQNREQESANVLDDVVIQETYEAEFEEEKHPVNLNLDYSDVLDIQERTSWRSVDHSDETGQTTLPDMHVSHPELANISPAPVKVFHVKMKNISRWELHITAGDGSVFRKIVGEGNPPKQIVWDGKSDEGLPLIAGHTYAYSLTAVDNAGNKGTFPGQSFTVPAFYLQEGDTVLVGLAGSRMVSADGFGLTPETKKFAREVATLIRYSATQNNVSLFGQIPYLDQFLEMIRADLIVEDGYFQRNKGKYVNRDAILFEIK